MANRFGARLFSPEEDIPPLVRLRIDIEAVDQAGNDTSEEGLRETLTWRGHDPKKDRWVVEAPDDPALLIGYGYLFQQTPERVASYVAVHPAWRRQGVGNDLLSQIISRTRDLGASQIAGGARAEDSPAAIFLQDSGFKPVSKNRFMHAAADVAAVPQWPRGYRVRTFADVQDLSMLHEAYVRSYQDISGHSANNPEAIAIEDMARWLPEWDPQGESITLLFAPDGDLAGVCRISRLMDYDEEKEGKPKFVIDAPGVVPAHRHHQLHRPLVQNAMRWIRERGQEPIELHSYGDSEETAGIYYDMGFTLDWQLIEYRLELNPS